MKQNCFSSWVIKNCKFAQNEEMMMNEEEVPAIPAPNQSKQPPLQPLQRPLPKNPNMVRLKQDGDKFKKNLVNVVDYMKNPQLYQKNKDYDEVHDNIITNLMAENSKPAAPGPHATHPNKP